jgi:hypothetical protein
MADLQFRTVRMLQECHGDPGFSIFSEYFFIFRGFVYRLAFIDISIFRKSAASGYEKIFHCARS